LSSGLALDPNSKLGLQTVIFASLNGSGDLDEAKRTLDNFPSGSKSSRFTIVYRLTDEPWGVRRFFVTDPNGIMANSSCPSRIPCLQGV
jgi:uncharacterized glyoxalase superfamily protein PhnB